ncbi:MAG: family 78 glycoside hydrolase catalytic domain [Firmicutes bacterium]|nr:family 78 glycoside hydrolase catalytic domain [Bacillota bacterium]
MFSHQFIAAGKEYADFGHHVPAPYLRKSFPVAAGLKKAEVTVCGLGFYDIFVNGQRITKGPLAPYISNPDDILYYDVYDLTPYLSPGENVLGFILGNGFLNNVGGKVWDLDLPDQARFRSAPKLALFCELTYADQNGDSETKGSFEADESFRTHPSPLLFDDLRCGEFYDARLEIPGWSEPGFDDSSWSPAIPAETPRGEMRLCMAEPIVSERELSPVSIRRGGVSLWPDPRKNLPVFPVPEDEPKEGWLYDFGLNSAGNVRLKIRGQRGQRVILRFGEVLAPDGGLDLRGMTFEPLEYLFKNIYILKGGEEEIYIPRFSYMGFRYCLVLGIEEAQATEDLLTFEIMHSGFGSAGSFSCSDPVVNALQAAARNADLSNFFYFPTDCPHREKNGWTGDANLSAEQMLLNFHVENSLKEWLFSIRKAMNDEGAIPGIVPTTGWGFAWGNGPSWDAVLFYLPYYIWLYRGDEQIIRENAHAMMRYLDYLSGRRDEKGLVHIGLGDWLHVGHEEPATPLEVTDTLKSMHIAHLAALMFRVIRRPLQAAFAEGLFEELKASARRELLLPDGATVLGRTQTGQAMGIAYGLFDEAEKRAAFDVLVRVIHEAGDRIDCGCIGIRPLFHVLAGFGEAELAYRMIVGPEFPSYGHWILEEDCTALFESFQKAGEIPQSKNHHFFGDISGWFYRELAGLKINPHERDFCEIEISPKFIPQLTSAQAEHQHPAGLIRAGWERCGEEIDLTVEVPDKIHGSICLPAGWVFAGTGDDCEVLKTNVYHISR